MSWLEGTVEDALKLYEKDFEVYKDAKKNHNGLLNEIDELQKRLKKNIKEEENLKQRVAELGGTDDADPETEIQSLRKKLEEKLSQNRASRDAEKASAEGKRNRALAENDKDLEQKVRDYAAAHEGDLQNLTETQQKALDFAKEELSYIKERDEKIRKSMDHTEVEKDKYDQIYERCTAQIEAYMDEYEPDLAEWQDVIDEINGRHMPGIEDKRGEYDFELNAKNSEIDLIHSQMKDEESLYDSSYSSLYSQYDETDKQYKKSIAAASLRNEPTAQLKISHNAALNRINEEITKLGKNHERSLQKLKIEESKVTAKYDKSLLKIQLEIDKLDAARLKELDEPQGTYNRIKNERDGKIAVPDNERKSALAHYNKEKAQDDADIRNYKKLCESKINALHEKMKSFAMEGDNCYSEKYEEASAPFVALASNITSYESAIELLPYKEDKNAQVKAEFRETLMNYDYKRLADEADNMSHIQTSLRAYYQYAWYILGGAIVLDALLFCLLKFVSHWGSFGAFVLPTLILGGIIWFMFKGMSSERDDILEALLLATEYKDFKVIDQHANELATSEEFSKLNNVGQDLLDQYKKRNDLFVKHDEKEERIRKNYTDTIAKLDKEYDEFKKKASKECDDKIIALKNSAESQNSNRDSELGKAKSAYSDIKKVNKKDQVTLEKCQKKKAEQDCVLDSFMKNYEEFFDKYSDMEIGLSESMANSKGVLNDNIYLISTADEGGEYGEVCSIKHVNHKKDPYLVLYTEEQDNNLARQEMILNMITDFLLAFKSINSKDVYKQYIIDSTGATTKLRKTNIQNLFNIAKICNGPDEMKEEFKKFILETERMLNNGQNIDDLNLNRSANEAPNIYKIVYFVFEGAANGRLSDDVAQLLKYEQSKESYGFLPIFICPKAEYEESVEKARENLYTQICNYVEDRTILYEADKYNDYSVQ